MDGEPDVGRADLSGPLMPVSLESPRRVLDALYRLNRTHAPAAEFTTWQIAWASSDLCIDTVRATLTALTDDGRVTRRRDPADGRKLLYGLVTP